MLCENLKKNDKWMILSILRLRTKINVLNFYYSYIILKILLRICSLWNMFYECLCVFTLEKFQQILISNNHALDKSLWLQYCHCWNFTLRYIIYIVNFTLRYIVFKCKIFTMTIKIIFLEYKLKIIILRIKMKMQKDLETGSSVDGDRKLNKNNQNNLYAHTQ